MSDKELNDLFYLCTLIEYMGRKTKNRRNNIVKILGKEEIKRQLELADVNHCLSYEQVADELIEKYKIKNGDFDNISNCKYKIPSFTSIGNVYKRLIKDVNRDNKSIINDVFNIYNSFINDEISDFNSSVYYSSPQYLKLSYDEGHLLD